MRDISKINRGRKRNEIRSWMLRRKQVKKYKSNVLHCTGSEARYCHIQLCIFQWKPTDFHKSKFSSSKFFICLGSSFMISENGVLKTVCGPSGQQVIWERRELHTEEPYNLCSSLNITMILNWGCMRKARNVSCFKEIKMH